MSILGACTLLAAALVISSFKEGYNVHDFPMWFKVLSAIGTLYAMYQPIGFAIFVFIHQILFSIGRPGQGWIALFFNVIALISFVWEFKPRQYKDFNGRVV